MDYWKENYYDYVMNAITNDELNYIKTDRDLTYKLLTNRNRHNKSIPIIIKEYESIIRQTQKYQNENDTQNKNKIHKSISKSREKIKVQQQRMKEYNTEYDETLEISNSYTESHWKSYWESNEIEQENTGDNNG